MGVISFPPLLSAIAGSRQVDFAHQNLMLNPNPIDANCQMLSIFRKLRQPKWCLFDILKIVKNSNFLNVRLLQAILRKIWNRNKVSFYLKVYYLVGFFFKIKR